MVKIPKPSAFYILLLIVGLIILGFGIYFQNNPEIIDSIVNPDPDPVILQDCCRTCTTGKACGEACISVKNRTHSALNSRFIFPAFL